jgi:hypothetical protein
MAKQTLEEKAALKKYRAVEKAKKLLREEGYFVDNLWCVDDVKGKFDCTDEEAQGVLYGALQNEATMEQIWLAIDIHGEADGLTPVNED